MTTHKSTAASVLSRRVLLLNGVAMAALAAFSPVTAAASAADRQTGNSVGVFQAARKPISEAHNRQETPGFAKSIERHGLKDK